MGRAEPTAMAVLAWAAQNDWHIDRLDHGRIREIVQGLVDRQEALQDDVPRRVKAQRKRFDEACSKVVLPLAH